MLDDEERKESFRNLVTSIGFLRLPEVEQQAEIAIRLAEGFISKADWNEIKIQLQRNLRVVSLNVGYNVMSNITAGSEAAFVETCQRFYPDPRRNRTDLSGWLYYAETGSITHCANNSAIFLLDHNLFGLQEVNPYFQQEFIAQIRNRGKNIGKDFEFYDNNYPGVLANNSLITGYDRNVMGQGILMTPANYNFGYQDVIGVLQATYFPKRNLLFINVHAPLNSQDINLAFRLSIAFGQIQENLPKIWPTTDFRNIRIIVVGDFNDCGGVLINHSKKGEFKIFGKELRLHVDPAQQEQHLLAAKNIEHTCCFPDYKCYGDYIFDSLPFPQKLYYVGPPIDYQKQVDLYSDHDPVVMLELDDFRGTTIQGEIYRSPPAIGRDEHISIAFKNLDRDMLFDIARLYHRKRRIDSRITKPLSWYYTFPHVSLKKEKYNDLRAREGDKVDVILKDLAYWPEGGWIVIEVIIRDKLINDNFVCHRTCHISIGQERIPDGRRG